MMQSESESKVRQEADRIHTRPVAFILLGSVVVAGGLVYWGWLELRAGERVAYPAGVPNGAPGREAPGAAVGIVQTLIDVDASAAASRAAARSSLRDYGWVDSAQGIARIPIDQAMRAVVERARP